MSTDPSSSSSQWYFPLEALQATPSTCHLEKELYDRARGIEFLFRLGTSLQLCVWSSHAAVNVLRVSSRPTSALCTAATWFHRFYMRYSMEEFHRQVGFCDRLPFISHGVWPRRMSPPRVYFWPPRLRNVAGSWLMLPASAIPKPRA